MGGSVWRRLLSLVDSEVKETILKINAIYTPDNGKKIQENLIKELQKRPRTITHGDARGNNIFKSSPSNNFNRVRDEKFSI